MIPRFGDSYHQLPARCAIGWPVPAPGYWTRFPQSAYEGLVGDLMGMGVPVAGHPASCATEGCGHAQVWHQAKTRFHKCEVPGCSCAAVVAQDLTGVPWAVPVRVAR